MSSGDRIFPETSSFQISKVSRYFRLLTKLCLFPVTLDSEKQCASFRFCSLKTLIHILFGMLAFSCQQIGTSLSFDQEQYWNETTKIFRDGAITDSISALSFMLTMVIFGFCLWNFFMNIGKHPQKIMFS